jgi:hypothetical protein
VHSLFKGVSQKLAKLRLEFCETMLVLKPKSEDWHNVRFSDEVHWRVGPQGKMRITWKPGERYCADCIQEQLNRDGEKDWEAAHSWAAVGYNFKTLSVFTRYLLIRTASSSLLCTGIRFLRRL